MNELVLKNISKKYGKKTALDNCSVSFKTGINALLGPNGAGKTTMMNIIVDLISLNSGEVLWNGGNIRALGAKYRETLGFMPQNISLYKNFSASDNLRYFGKLKGMEKETVEEKIPDLLKKVNLLDCADKKFGSLSGGMKRRLGLAVAVMNEPELLVFDEPTAGLDPKERINFREIIEQMSEKAVIILSTHITSDVEASADNIVLLKNGRVYDSGSASELEEKYLTEKDEKLTSLEAVYMKIFDKEKIRE